MSPPSLAAVAVDGIGGLLSWPTLSAGGVLALAVILILTGRLQPRFNLDRQERETAFWREAHKASEAARAAQADQLRDLLDGSRTVLDLLRAMQSARDRT